MTMKSTSGVVRQRGAITFVETLGVLIVASLVMPAVWGWLSDDADNKINQVTADHDKQVVRAAEQYIKDNYAVVLASASAATPATITVPMLQSQYPQLFASGFSAKNPYQQTVTVQAYQTTPGSLDTLIVTSGGQAISERNMRKISQLVGGAGGYISSTNPNAAVGTYGAWGPMTIPSSPGAGHMVYSLMFQNGSLVSDYLYRKVVPGHPELNQMNTAIDMGGNNVNNAATVNAQKVVLPPGNNLQIGNSGFYGDNSGNSALYQDGRLFVQHHDGSAADVAIVGNINSVGTVTANGAMVNGTTNMNGDANIGGALRATGTGYYDTAPNSNLFLKPWNPGGEVVVGGGGGDGRLHATGRIQGDEYIQVNGAATAGAPCGGSTLIGSSGSGPLFCQSGVWKPAGGGTLYLSGYILPPNSTTDLGVHMYCATADGGGNSYGGTGLNAYAGTNAYGSKMWDFLGMNYGSNGPVIFCLDQQ
ncbi:hypothetical protein LMG28614_06184 [Paraburkholderia ultramafica]|uniref:Bacterial shufflon protein N-terminal domain-containing protein n=1 Tax=Paraburkholderia ultramafica TaxID=1544867 RepID=A0A6S7BNG9_9BURK|nr:shufflon system plasmid conjugative transfer pilus tip adhesin PilV [Paraburkholderia ultramafica]CAB3805328.1 hypothetical protein LMG28614_06184 [Paraburkholderia ultramafica]